MIFGNGYNRQQQQQQQPFYGPLSRTTQVSQYQKKHSPTHTNPDHQPYFIRYNTDTTECTKFQKLRAGIVQEVPYLITVQ